MIHRLMAELRTLEAQPLPTAEEKRQAKAELRAAAAKLEMMEGAPSHKQAQIQTAEARVKQRVMTLAQTRVRAIARHFRAIE